MTNNRLKSTRLRTREILDVKHQGGFTLIEMIGVLAVVAILVALVLPRIFDVIADSKISGFTAAVRTYETAVVNYYADVGSLLPLNATGVPTAETGGNSATAIGLPARLQLDASDALNTGAGRWPKFKGPYLSSFVTSAPPGIGASIKMPSTNPIALGTAVTTTNLGWDTNDDGSSDQPATAAIVYLIVEDVSDTDFDRVDAILDPGIGTTTAVKVLRGRVKYDAGTDVMLVYLSHG